MADTLTKLAYQALQQGKSLVGVAHKEVSTKLMELVAPQGAPKTRPVPPQMLMDLQAAHSGLMDIDWEEAQEGLYPTSLLFEFGDSGVDRSIVWPGQVFGGGLGEQDAGGDIVFRIAEEFLVPLAA